jgi:thioesterase domain-containing protein
MRLAQKIQELRHSKIPITRAMGGIVEDDDGKRLVLSAPLEANVNYLGTPFGGSLNALAVLERLRTAILDWQLNTAQEGCPTARNQSASQDTHCSL